MKEISQTEFLCCRLH